MKTSIVIPMYNAEKYITATIESVIAQTRPDWELILVDDGSRDLTASIARSYVTKDARIQLVVRANGGVATARNEGFLHTDPESAYVGFLDHDDVYEPRMLEHLAGALDANPTAVGAHGVGSYIDAMGQPIRPGELEKWTRERLGVRDGRVVAWPRDEPTTFAVEALCNCLMSPGQALIRRSALEMAPFDPATAPADDYDLWMRLTLQGDLIFCDEVVLYYRWHETNQSRHAAKMSAADYAVRRKLLTAASVAEEKREMVGLGWRLWEEELISRRRRWAKEALAQGQVMGGIKQLCLAARHRYQAMVHIPRLIANDRMVSPPSI